MRRYFILASLFLGSACAAVHRPSTTVEAIAASAAPARDSALALRARAVERLAQRMVLRGDRTIDILLLSGGGQNGSYGAGFLKGWVSHPTNPMPAFDVVTGISTGALQSPFALIGTGERIDTLAALYRRAADRIAPTVDVLFWLRHTGGVVNTGRYKKSIATIFDSTMERELRARFAESRQLFVGSVDLDLGQQRAWDVSALLARDSGLAHVHEILLAATAIPSIFPPVLLEGHLHSDGGIMGNLLPLLGLADYRALAARVRELGVAEPVTVRVWAIYNVWLEAAPAVIDPSDRGKIATRAEMLGFQAQQPGILAWLDNLRGAVASSVEGMTLEVRATAIPLQYISDPRARKLFDKEWMAALEQVGFERARSTAPWETHLTDIEADADNSQ
jgi:hypothetical protein